MKIAAELEIPAGEELQHALIIAKQIDYLGGMPKVVPKPSRVQNKQRIGFDSTWKTRMRRSVTIGSAGATVKQWARML